MREFRKLGGILCSITILLFCSIFSPRQGFSQSCTKDSKPSEAALSRDFPENSLLKLSECDVNLYISHVKHDFFRFKESAAKLEQMSDSAFRDNSFLDKLSETSTLTSAKQLRRMYLFWSKFLKHLNVINEISEKYHRGWKDLLTGSLRKSFEGYFLGVSAKVCRLITAAKLVNFLGTKPKLFKLLNEGNPGFSIPPGMVDSISLKSLNPKELYSIYQFHLTHFDEVEKFYYGEGWGKPAVDTKGILKTYYESQKEVLDNLIGNIAKDSRWYKLVFGKLGAELKDFIFPAQKALF
ncbi:hypothetical protein HYY75_01100, partial [bacterium]|nr:hypothetical protein [bacterium]